MKIWQHPVLQRREYLGAYVGLWVILAWLFIVSIQTSSGMALGQAILLLSPMLVLYAVMALSGWYVCNAAPLRKVSLTQVFVRQMAAGLLLSFLWLQAGAVYARLLWRNAAFRGITDRYASHQTLLLLDGVLLYLLVIGFFLRGGCDRSFARNRSAGSRNQRIGARGGITGAAGADQPAFPVQQFELHQRADQH